MRSHTSSSSSFAEHVSKAAACITFAEQAFARDSRELVASHTSDVARNRLPSLKGTCTLIQAHIVSILSTREWLLQQVLAPLVLAAIFSSIFLTVPFDLLGLHARVGSFALLLAIMSVDGALATRRYVQRAAPWGSDAHDGLIPKSTHVLAQVIVYVFALEVWSSVL
jgi:hypothetical protein